MIVVPTVQHSGTHYILDVIGRTRSKLYQSGMYKRGREVIHGHLDQRTEQLLEFAKGNKVVIPIRHPAKIAVSWKKRGPARWRTKNFLEQWVKIDLFDGFCFPLETKPFDELEQYLGQGVNRIDKLVASLGEYDEKRNLETARDFLGNDWSLVEEALATPIGRKFYA